jgi:hypothetical protein
VLRIPLARISQSEFSSSALQLIYECNPSHGISLVSMINAKLLNAHWWCDEFVQTFLHIKGDFLQTENYEIKLNYENDFFCIIGETQRVILIANCTTAVSRALKTYVIAHAMV